MKMFLAWAAVGVICGVAGATSSQPATAPSLTLTPNTDATATVRSDWTVGALAIERYGVTPPATDKTAGIAATQPNGLAADPAGGTTLGALGRMVDMTGGIPAGAYQLDVYRLVAPGRQVQPFAAVARESNPDNLDDKAKLGVGAGTLINLSKRATFGTELIVFPADRDMPASDGVGKFGDVRVMTRLQIKF